MTIEDQVKSIILQKHKSLRAFTQAIGLPYSTVDSMLRNGISGTGLQTVTKICHALDIDVDSISAGRIKYAFHSDISAEEAAHLQTYRLLTKQGKRAVDLNMREIVRLEQSYQSKLEKHEGVIPFRISEQSAAAGYGTYLGPECWRIVNVEDNALTERASFGVPVSGDSMEPKYHDSDILMVADEPIEKGDIGVFTLDNSGYVKMLGDGELISLNSQYGPIPLNESIIPNGKVIGTLPKEWIK